ncbi:MAG TPA: hypothetical protein VG125_27055 [Pirellulales bacterium]|jgi:predicted peptidase|nr:hypothetical protein [Pirellulales bacterium]
MDLLLCAVSLLASFAAAEEQEYEAHTHKSRDGHTMPYRLLRPENYDKSKRYPLVLVLHGWGERGTDNKSQLQMFGAAFLMAEAREKFPCFVLLPQTDGSWVRNPKFEKPIALTPKPALSLQLTVDILDSLQKSERVDADRLYLTGYSNGACGVWELLERVPRRWAAAVPMAGAGDPEHVAAAKGVAIWAFHGASDSGIPLERMTELMSALRSAHGAPLYTIVPNGQHYDAKVKALADPSLLPWLFAQRRGKPAVPFDKIASASAKRPTSLDEADQSADKSKDTGKKADDKGGRSKKGK